TNPAGNILHAALADDPAAQNWSAPFSTNQVAGRAGSVGARLAVNYIDGGWLIDPPLSGEQWPLPTQTDAWQGLRASVTDCGGLPAIVYHSREDALKTFRFVRASDSTGEAWEEPIILASIS